MEQYVLYKMGLLNKSMTFFTATLCIHSFTEHVHFTTIHSVDKLLLTPALSRGPTRNLVDLIKPTIYQVWTDVRF